MVKDKNTLIVFVKAPSGKVKTRLAKTIGQDKAISVYKTMVDVLVSELSNIPDFSLILYCCGPQDYFDERYPNIPVKDQCQAPDLGERMKHALSEELATASNAILIGSDCPSISSDNIRTAFNHLKKNDIVLGPTFDGGYYLIGMPKLLDFWSNIQWSETSVLKDSIDLINRQDLRYALLDKKNDVDHESDLKHYPFLKGLK